VGEAVACVDKSKSESKHKRMCVSRGPSLRSRRLYSHPPSSTATFCTVANALVVVDHASASCRVQLCERGGSAMYFKQKDKDTRFKGICSFVVRCRSSDEAIGGVVAGQRSRCLPNRYLQTVS